MPGITVREAPCGASPATTQFNFEYNGTPIESAAGEERLWWGPAILLWLAGGAIGWAIFIGIGWAVLQAFWLIFPR